jgi:hypothetical protein
MNDYRIDRMNISDVCEWLLSVSNSDECRTETQLAMALKMYYGSRNITRERTDILRDIFTSQIEYGTDVFRSMECDVTTHMVSIPVYEAHVD